MHNMRLSLPAILLTLVAFSFWGSCSKGPKQEAIPTGPLMTQSIHFQYAIYYLTLPSKDPSAALRQTLANEQRMPTLVNEMQETPSEALVCAYSHNNVKEEYAPPDMESLRYFGHGLTRRQVEDLQKCEQAFIMDFGHPKDNVWEGVQTANRLAELMARETGGLLWDEETREVFTPDEWHKKRISSWTSRIPDISDHTTIHAYKSDEYVRAITLGMSKFGLPDVIVEEFSWSMNRSMGQLINLFCQAIVEGASIAEHGEFDLDIRSIKNKKVRDAQIESLKSNAKAVALLALRNGKWEEGDPKNRLIEIVFDRYSGRDVHAQQQEMLSSLFGWEDAITPVKHNEQLLAASRNARTKLPMLRKAFSDGLEPGEFIQFKAPFKTPDGGQEWMWVEVTAWEGNSIKGLLKNEPFNIPSLHGGQIVEVKQEDIFDYIRRYPDGRQEGNETGKIIQKMQQESDRY